MRFIGDSEKWKQKSKSWGSVASIWDIETKNPNHFVNFENGYKKFTLFESKILRGIGLKDSGLDIGCGTGLASAQLAKYVKNLYLLDISDKMLIIAKSKYPYAKIFCASGTEMPIEDSSIDIAISRGIIISLLAYKEEIDKFIDEVYRILRSDGIVVYDFLSNTKTAKFKLKESYKRSFTKYEMRSLLENRKFYKIKFDGSKNARVIRVCATKR